MHWVQAIEHSCRTRCGYATVVNAEHHSVEDRMESFFLSETTKYLYLLFDPENFIHADGTVARIVETPNGQCIIDAGGYIFNTEAHPLDPGIVYCCSAKRNSDLEMLTRFGNNIDLVSLGGIFDETFHPFGKNTIFENMENTGNGKHYFKQSSLTSSSIYDYIAVYDIRYTNCCWPTDHLIENIPFRRFFNVMFAKHIYPATGVKFFLGSICLPTGNNIPDVSHQIDRPRMHKVVNTQKFGSVDEIYFDKFRYRNMAGVDYDALLTPPLSYFSRFTGLGQVKPKSDVVR